MQTKGGAIKKYILVFLIICLTVLLYPLIPNIAYHIQEQSFTQRYTSAINAMVKTASVTIPIAGNSIYMPQIGVNAGIEEGGDGASALEKGAWHIPGSGTPLQGNMVLAGHRFAYLPPNPNTFYNLDKLKSGQLIFLAWQGKTYTYAIDKIFVTNQDNIQVLAPTMFPTLTLITCTPLWTAQQRLIVQAGRL